MRHEFKGPGRQAGFIEWVALGSQALSTAFGIFGAGRAADKAEKEARKAARAMRISTNYAVENLRRAEERTEGETTAAAAGSGVSVESGSVLDTMAENARNFSWQRAALKRQGSSQVQASLASGDALAKQYQGQQLASAFSGLTQMAAMASEYGMFSRSPTNPNRRTS